MKVSECTRTICLLPCHHVMDALRVSSRLVRSLCDPFSSDHVHDVTPPESRRRTWKCGEGLLTDGFNLGVAFLDVTFRRHAASSVAKVGLRWCEETGSFWMVSISGFFNVYVLSISFW